jgi:hypothetical protein
MAVSPTRQPRQDQRPHRTDPEPVTSSAIRLPRDLDIYEPFEVYLNGVPQRHDIDYTVEGRTLLFTRALRKDHITGWRWLLGAWGVGTYKQDDTIDIRYEVDGQLRLAHALDIINLEDEP